MDQIETLKTVIRWLCIVLVVVCILWGATTKKSRTKPGSKGTRTRKS